MLFNRIAVPETPMRVQIGAASPQESKEDSELNQIILLTNIKLSSFIVASSIPRPVDIEQPERTLSVRQKESERARSLSSDKILDPIHSRLSKSNENILQSTSANADDTAQRRPSRITRSEDRPPVGLAVDEVQLQRYQVLKERFERQQPIDIVFGLLKILLISQQFHVFLLLRFIQDPRKYPFKVLLQQPYPLVNVDVHLLSQSSIAHCLLSN